MKAYPAATRARAISLLKEGKPSRVAAQQVGVSIRTVNRWKAEDTENIPINKGGHPKKLSARDDTIIARYASTGQIPTATAIQQVLKHNAGIDVSRHTVARSLKRSGLSAHAKRKKPLLRANHRKARLAFARRYQSWTAEQWRRVFFSDETRINRFGSDGREYCWRRRGEQLRDHHTVPTVKHGGGSLMAWACFCAAGPGYICQIEGNMTAEDYIGILESDLRDSLEYYKEKVPDPIFQHDNDPKHTARMTRAWLDESGLEILDWPSQSPDLNPVEHLWCLVKQKLKSYPTVARSIGELWDRVVEIWNGLTESECSHFIDSMPRRISAVIAAKGGHTKY